MEILGLNLWEFIFTIFNFLLLLFLLKKFLYKPILKMLDDRKKSIDEALDAADSARQEGGLRLLRTPTLTAIAHSGPPRLSLARLFCGRVRGGH